MNKSICCEVTDVSKDRDVGPVLAQYALTVLIGLAERDRAKAAGLLEAERHPADAGEKVEDLELHGSLNPRDHRRRRPSAKRR